MVTDCDNYGDACDPVAGRSKMRRDLRLSIFSILPFPLSENTRGRISERSGNVEGPGALLTSKQIFFGAMRRSAPVSSLEKSNSIPVA